MYIDRFDKLNFVLNKRHCNYPPKIFCVGSVVQYIDTPLVKRFR